MTEVQPPHSGAQPPEDWWQRETQRRQRAVLVLLGLLLALIAYYYYVSITGAVGMVDGVNFDSKDHIVFVRQQPNGATDLYAIRADGTDLRRLTRAEDHSEKSAPCWTADGKAVLYASNYKDASRTEIYVLGAGDPKQLTYGTDRKDGPEASPDGKHVAFLSQGTVRQIYLNGNDEEQILPAPKTASEDTNDTGMPQMDPPGAYINAHYGPDGFSIAGVQELNASEETGLATYTGGDELARALPAGANTASILDGGRFVTMQWVPSSKKLLVDFAERQVTQNGMPMVVGGISLWSFTNPTRPTETPLIITEGYGVMPRNAQMSPDGSHLAFELWSVTSDQDRSPKGIVIIPTPSSPVVIPASEAKKVPVALPAGQQGIPCVPKWSPDGSRLLFQLIRPDHGSDLCVIGSDLTNLVNLTRGVGDNTQAQWCPLTGK